MLATSDIVLRSLTSITSALCTATTIGSTSVLTIAITRSPSSSTASSSFIWTIDAPSELLAPDGRVALYTAPDTLASVIICCIVRPPTTPTACACT